MIKALVAIAALAAALFLGFVAIEVCYVHPGITPGGQEPAPATVSEAEAEAAAAEAEAAAARRARWSRVATMGGGACLCTSMGCLLLIDLVVLLRVIAAVCNRKAGGGRWTSGSHSADDWEPVRSFANEEAPPDQWVETLDVDGGARPDEGGA